LGSNTNLELPTAHWGQIGATTPRSAFLGRTKFGFQNCWLPEPDSNYEYAVDTDTAEGAQDGDGE
jgi:hypothetical protein